MKPAVREQTLMALEYWINHAYLERLRKKAVKPYGIIEKSLGVAAEGEMEYGKSEAFDVIEQPDD